MKTFLPVSLFIYFLVELIWFFKESFLEAVRTNLNDNIIIGVHVNISAYAPFQQINQFLYHFLCFGILWDVVSGEMLSISRNIKWLVSKL